MADSKNQKFETLLIESIDDGLVKVLGSENAKCVSFYLDPHIAVSNPDNYARSMLKLFGVGTKPLLDAVLDNLHQKTGTQKSAEDSFGADIENTKRAYAGS